MKTIRNMILGALAMAGAWCAQAEAARKPIFTKEVDGGPVTTVYRDEYNDDYMALFHEIGAVKTSGRFVMLVDLYPHSTAPTWSSEAGMTSITVDLNGHVLEF